jgi:hypothetical protein
MDRSLNTEAVLGHWLAALWFSVMIVLVTLLLLIPEFFKGGWRGVVDLFDETVLALACVRKIWRGEINEYGTTGPFPLGWAE